MLAWVKVERKLYYSTLVPDNFIIRSEAEDKICQECDNNNTFVQFVIYFKWEFLSIKYDI